MNLRPATAESSANSSKARRRPRSPPQVPFHTKPMTDGWSPGSNGLSPTVDRSGEQFAVRAMTNADSALAGDAMFHADDDGDRCSLRQPAPIQRGLVIAVPGTQSGGFLIRAADHGFDRGRSSVTCAAQA